MNKKGAEMTIGTIIIIVLALVVLVVLVYGFSTGWSNLWEKITGFGGGKVNVQSVVQSCQLACTTGSTYDYCTKTRKLIETGADGKAKESQKRCIDLVGNTYGLERCTNVDCGGGVEKGICGGDKINPDCVSKNNQGEVKCKEVLGCKWTDDANSDNVNLGNCEIDLTIKCPSYNDKKDECLALKCTWTPTTP